MSGVARSSDLPAAATWGLLWAWAVHDAEELLTMPGWLDRARPRLRRRLPFVPDRVWDHLRVTRPQAAVALGTMGAVMAVAAARGARTGGRSRLYRYALLGFGLHAGGHLAQSAVTRGYTPGVATAPLLVAPFSVWAWRRLRVAGGPAAQLRPAEAVTAAALMPVAAASCHALARLVAPGPRAGEG